MCKTIKSCPIFKNLRSKMVLIYKLKKLKYHEESILQKHFLDWYGTTLSPKKTGKNHSEHSTKDITTTMTREAEMTEE